MVNVRIREIRVCLKLTQEKFSCAIGLKQGTIADWERGKSSPSIETLNNIANSFNVNLNWLITGKGEMFLSEPSVGAGLAPARNSDKELKPTKTNDNITKLKEDIAALENENKKLNQELVACFRKLVTVQEQVLSTKKT